MNIVIVDTNPARQNELSAMLKSIYPSGQLVLLNDTFAAIEYLDRNTVDVVFAECDMKPMDGIVFRDMVHNLKPSLRVIITDDNNYEELTPADIILIRPVTHEKIIECLMR